jgi:hypothetical protein
MAEINLNPYTAESDAIARRLRMAEALQQQSMTPLEQPQQAGVKISPYAGLAKLLQGYTSGLAQNQAQAQQAELGKRYAADTGADFQSMIKALSAPAQAAVPEGAPTYTPNIGAGELADNARMTMQPERNELGEIIAAGEPGAGNFGVTPGAPAQAAIAAGRLTAKDFSAMRTPMGQQQFMAQLLGQMKPKEPIKLGKDESLIDPVSLKPIYQPTAAKNKPILVGNVLVDPDTLKPVYTGELAPRTGVLGVYDEYVKQEKAANRIPKSIEQFETAQRIAGRAPAAINYGSPVAATDAEGRPVFIQAGRAGGAPAVIEGFSPPVEKLKPIPPSINTAVIENQKAGNQIDRAIALLKGKDISGMVGDKNAVGLKGYLPTNLLNRIDPAGVSARAEIADIGSLKIHDRSGAAVTASESPRLMPFIPLTTDDTETALKKLTRLKLEIDTTNEAYKDIYSKEQGYRENPVLTREKVFDTLPANALNALKEGQVTAFKNGQSWTLQQGKPVQVK